MNPRLLVASLVTPELLTFSTTSIAANACDGPEQCCGPIEEGNPAARTTVSVGVAIQNVHNLEEKAGGWDVDYYSYEKWPASRGFTSQTEIVNETAREDAPRSS
jgi:hypothetical protein